MLWLHRVIVQEKVGVICTFRKLDFKDHHELLDLRWHAVLSVPGVVDFENFLYEMGSQLDVFKIQNYQYVK